MASLAHLVRASGCGSEGDGFDPRSSPHIELEYDFFVVVFFMVYNKYQYDGYE